MHGKKQTIFRTGNSLAVSIPAKMVKSLGIYAGQDILVDTDMDNGRLIIEFPDRTQLSLLGVSQQTDHS